MGCCRFATAYLLLRVKGIFIKFEIERVYSK